jgi:hypothetical protein
MAFETSAEAIVLRSPTAMDGIQAQLSLPAQAQYGSGYLAFYVGFGDQIEAGVSYSPKGWNRFLNNHGLADNRPGGLALGSSVVLSLNRDASGHVTFSVDDEMIGPGCTLAGRTQVKMVMAVLDSAGSEFGLTVFALQSAAGTGAWTFNRVTGAGVSSPRINAVSTTVNRFAAQMP